VARGYSAEPNHLADLIAGGIQHKGFALIDVFSPCVTYNKVNTFAYFKKRVYKLEAETGYDPNSMSAAMARSAEWGERIPIGLLYKDEQPTYEDSERVFRKGPLTQQTLPADQAVFQTLIDELL
jgi:2-oxoglutarate ferredoxin oxidoreductase subunit beta